MSCQASSLPGATHLSHSLLNWVYSLIPPFYSGMASLWYSLYTCWTLGESLWADLASAGNLAEIDIFRRLTLALMLPMKFTLAVVGFDLVGCLLDPLVVQLGHGALDCPDHVLGQSLQRFQS